MAMAERLACDLAARGLVIFSGLARGVDTAGHRGAIVAKGKTVAVFGTGIDIIYPKENTRLAEQILSFGGALVSEFPLSSFAAPQNSPKRNRIISGLSIGVLVVEAAEYSGTRITARCALEQNRDVFAVPGNVTNKNSWGPNTLIKQGTSWWQPGKMFGKNFRQMCGLRWNPQPALNRKPDKLHLYSRKAIFRLTKKRSCAAQGRRSHAHR